MYKKQYFLYITNTEDALPEIMLFWSDGIDKDDGTSPQQPPNMNPDGIR